jgi:hypothetical protein
MPDLFELSDETGFETLVAYEVHQAGMAGRTSSA